MFETLCRPVRRLQPCHVCHVCARPPRRRRITHPRALESFCALLQAAQLEGLMRRPRAMLAALELDDAGRTPLQARQPDAKKRSRLAAFGQ